MAFGRGVTNCPVDKAKERVAKANEYGWVMILREGTFAGPDHSTFTVEQADIFKVERAGMVAPPNALPCRDMTTAMFSVNLSVGPYSLKLFPHEFSPMSMTQILSLVADKELEVKYLSQNDTTGYYTPTPEVREIIRANF